MIHHWRTVTLTRVCEGTLNNINHTHTKQESNTQSKRATQKAREPHTKQESHTQSKRVTYKEIV